MGKYRSEAKKLLELVGGKGNIASVTHCATRMRFALVDEAKANVKEIQGLPTVKGTFTNAGQFQVIMGNDVGDFYKDFIGLSGIESASKEDKLYYEEIINQLLQLTEFIKDNFDVNTL